MNLKLYRVKMGLTQDELAKKSGVCRTNVSKIENGDVSSLKLETMKRLAEALDTTVKELFFQE